MRLTVESCNRLSRNRFAAALVLGCVALAGGCSRDPQVRSQQFFERGEKYFAEGRYPEAILEYRNALELNATSGKAYAKLGEAYTKTGDGVGALKAYVRAADLLPQDYDVQIAAGRQLLIVGRTDEALVRAETVLKAHPDRVDAHVLRGNALANLKDLDRALVAMEEALRLDPARAETYTHLGAIEYARGRRGEAEAALKKAIALEPKRATGHMSLAHYYWAGGQLAEAENALRAALAIDPALENANRALAVLAIAQGRAAEAEQYLVKIADTSASPAAVFALTEYYVAMGRMKDAITRLEPLANRPTGAAAAKERLARAYAAAKDRPRAHELVDGILKEEPRAATALLLKGQLLWDDRRRAEALTSVRAAVDADPTSVPAQFTLGKLYAASGDALAAQNAFQEVLRLNPAAGAAQLELAKVKLIGGDTAGSLRHAESIVKSQPQSLEARLALVRGLLAAKDLRRAEQEIADLVAAHPKVAALHVQRGILAVRRKQPAIAKAAFEQALTLDPNSQEALGGMIALDLEARDVASARRRLEARLSAGKPTPDLLMLAAHTYASAGDFAATERVLRQAIETDPTLLTAYAMLGQVYLAQKKLDSARQEFDNVAQRQAKPVAALTMSGMILLEQGNIPMARERFQRALAVDSKAPVAANNLAWIHAEHGGDLNTALELAQTASTVSPDIPEIMDTLGWVYYKKNLPALAIPLLLRCTEKNPENAVYHYHLGLAYAQSGDGARASASFRRGLTATTDAALRRDLQKALNDQDARAAAQGR